MHIAIINFRLLGLQPIQIEGGNLIRTQTTWEYTPHQTCGSISWELTINSVCRIHTIKTIL